MTAVVILVALALVLGAVVAGSIWLRQSGLLPGWLTSNEFMYLPAQALFFLACLFLPFVAFPLLFVYVTRERRRRANSHPDAATG
jgi:uncharacterized BrkB/YihY/UPF0761 family membrane protein